MIFYFSGTGNSKWLARTVADAFNDKTAPMGDYFKEGALPPIFNIGPDEKIGFIFPVHSWGIPPLVSKFIERVKFENYNENLIYGIFTCGDECGSTRKKFLGSINRKGYSCQHAYSVQMPNNYIVLPGFDVDPKELEQSKKEKAIKLVPELIKAIETDTPVDSYNKGSLTFLKSGLIFPLFRKYGIDSRPFYSTDKCDSCGVCVARCPTGNIELVNDRPHWGNNCTQCLACIHYCPTRAIEYRNATVKKGRYTFTLPTSQHSA